VSPALRDMKLIVFMGVSIVCLFALCRSWVRSDFVARYSSLLSFCYCPKCYWDHPIAVCAVSESFSKWDI